MADIYIRLTPYQAKILWGVIDGAADAGSCSDGSGNSERETNALGAISYKLLKHHAKWKDAKL